MDRIIVLAAGLIVEQGGFRECLRSFVKGFASQAGTHHTSWRSK